MYLGEPRQHAVEDVVVPLLRALPHQPGLLQQVLLDPRALYRAVRVEEDVDVLAKAGRVVVPHCLGISKC